MGSIITLPDAKAAYIAFMGVICKDGDNMLIRTGNKLINLDNIDYIKVVAIGTVGDPAIAFCIGEKEIELGFIDVQAAFSALDEIQNAYLNDVKIFDLRPEAEAM
jgi:hypothetical protein